jgi:hypothetical protein
MLPTYLPTALNRQSLMEDNLTVESDYREMMKRWLYDFLFEKVIIHAKYLNPVQFSYDLIIHPKGRKRKSASLSTHVQSHFQPKETRTAPIKMRAYRLGISIYFAIPGI